MADARRSMRLEEATREALALMGVGVLRQPSRFLSCLMDLMDADAPELRVLERNCDEELLGRLYEAAVVPDPEAMRSARESIAWELSERRFIADDVARSVASGLACGLASFLGLDPYLVRHGGTEKPDAVPTVVQPVPVERKASRGGAIADSPQVPIPAVQVPRLEAKPQKAPWSPAAVTPPTTQAAKRSGGVRRLFLVLSLLLVTLALGGTLLYNGVFALSIGRTDIVDGVWTRIEQPSGFILNNSSSNTIHVIKVRPYTGTFEYKSIYPGYRASLADDAGWNQKPDGGMYVTRISQWSDSCVISLEAREQSYRPVALLAYGNLGPVPAVVSISGMPDFITGRVNTTIRTPKLVMGQVPRSSDAYYLLFVAA